MGQSGRSITASIPTSVASIKTNMLCIQANLPNTDESTCFSKIRLLRKPTDMSAGNSPSNCLSKPVYCYPFSLLTQLFKLKCFRGRHRGEEDLRCISLAGMMSTYSWTLYFLNCHDLRADCRKCMFAVNFGKSKAGFLSLPNFFVFPLTNWPEATVSVSIYQLLSLNFHRVSPPPSVILQTWHRVHFVKQGTAESAAATRWLMIEELFRLEVHSDVSEYR